METTLGSILISMGSLSEEQLADLLRFQKDVQQDQFGALCVSMGLCSSEEIQIALGIQKRLRSTKEYEKAAAFVDVALHRKQNNPKIEQSITAGKALIRKKTSSEYRAIAAEIPGFRRRKRRSTNV